MCTDPLPGHPPSGPGRHGTAGTARPAGAGRPERPAQHRPTGGSAAAGVFDWYNADVMPSLHASPTGGAVLQKFDERNRDLIVNVSGHLTHRDKAAISPFDSAVQ